MKKTLSIRDTNIDVLKKIDDNVDFLQVNRCGLRDISSLEKNYASLTAIDLSGNFLKNVMSLKLLGNVTYVDLSNNRVESLSFMEGNIVVERLNVSHNRVEGVSPLRGCEALRHLLLDHNFITDISPLKGLGSLYLLGLDNNRIVDVSPLEGVPALETVALRHNRIKDVRSLRDLRATTLFVDHNEIIDPSPLWGNTHIISLSLGHNPMVQNKEIALLYMKEFNACNSFKRRTTLRRMTLDILNVLRGVPPKVKYVYNPITRQNKKIITYACTPTATFTP